MLNKILLKDGYVILVEDIEDLQEQVASELNLLYEDLFQVAHKFYVPPSLHDDLTSLGKSEDDFFNQAEKSIGIFTLNGQLSLSQNPDTSNYELTIDAAEVNGLVELKHLFKANEIATKIEGNTSHVEVSSGKLVLLKVDVEEYWSGYHGNATYGRISAVGVSGNDRQRPIFSIELVDLENGADGFFDRVPEDWTWYAIIGYLKTGVYDSSNYVNAVDWFYRPVGLASGISLAAIYDAIAKILGPGYAWDDEPPATLSDINTEVNAITESGIFFGVKDNFAFVFEEGNGDRFRFDDLSVHYGYSFVSVPDYVPADPSVDDFERWIPLQLAMPIGYDLSELKNLIRFYVAPFDSPLVVPVADYDLQVDANGRAWIKFVKGGFFEAYKGQLVLIKHPIPFKGDIKVGAGTAKLPNGKVINSNIEKRVPVWIPFEFNGNRLVDVLSKSVSISVAGTTDTDPYSPGVIEWTDPATRRDTVNNMIDALQAYLDDPDSNPFPQKWIKVIDDEDNLLLSFVELYNASVSPAQKLKIYDWSLETITDPTDDDYPDVLYYNGYIAVIEGGQLTLGNTYTIEVHVPQYLGLNRLLSLIVQADGNPRLVAGDETVEDYIQLGTVKYDLLLTTIQSNNGDQTDYSYKGVFAGTGTWEDFYQDFQTKDTRYFVPKLHTVKEIKTFIQTDDIAPNLRSFIGSYFVVYDSSSYVDGDGKLVLQKDGMLKVYGPYQGNPVESDENDDLYIVYTVEGEPPRLEVTYNSVTTTKTLPVTGSNDVRMTVLENLPRGFNEVQLKLLTNSTLRITAFVIGKDLPVFSGGYNVWGEVPVDHWLEPQIARWYSTFTNGTDGTMIRHGFSSTDLVVFVSPVSSGGSLIGKLWAEINSQYVVIYNTGAVGVQLDVLMLYRPRSIVYRDVLNSGSIRRFLTHGMGINHFTYTLPLDLDSGALAFGGPWWVNKGERSDWVMSGVLGTGELIRVAAVPVMPDSFIFYNVPLDKPLIPISHGMSTLNHFIFVGLESEIPFDVFSIEKGANTDFIHVSNPSEEYKITLLVIRQPENFDA